MLETKREKRALLIGINQYPNLPPFSQLRGCVNDVLLMKTLLKGSFRFPANNIVTLCDEKATVKGIRNAMEQLLLDCGPDDIVVFHFSGHGSQMAAEKHKPRGYDESIMPYDSGRMNLTFPKQVTPCDIRDTEIQEWLVRLSRKTSYITLLFDSCHSGSITRSNDDGEGTNLRWIPPDPLPAGSYESPGPRTVTGTIARDAQGNGWLAASDKYVVLAACAADQGAYELDHEKDGVMTRNGAFTFFLSQEITQASKSVTYQDIWDRVSIQVNNRFQKQTPQIEGAGNRQIFDVKDFRPRPYLLITARDGEKVTLNGGRVHDVIPGSYWTVYPAVTKSTEDQTDDECGVIKIVSSDSVTSRGSIFKEHTPQAITPGTHAEEFSRPDDETLMPIWLSRTPKEIKAKLRPLLKESRLLTITNSPKGAWARVKITCRNGNAGKTEPLWDVRDQSNELLMPGYSVLAPEAPHKIKDNLETIWRYVKLQELHNPSSSLRGGVDFVLLKREPGKGWQEVEGDEATYVDGDSIAFRVINHTKSSIHVTVLDFGISKRISLLYPPGGASEEIAPQRSGDTQDAGTTGGLLSVGESLGTTIDLFLPHDQIGPEVQRGKECFKAIITTSRHDLGFLRQSGLRIGTMKQPEHPLEKLIYLADVGGLTRETCLRFNSSDEWLTIERSFWLERKR